MITHPAGTMVVSNGRKGISEVIDTEYERTSFSTVNHVSVSSLGWALLNEVQTASTALSEELRNSFSTFSRRSDPQIYVYSETGQNPEEYLFTGAEIFNRVASDLNIEFPFGDLHVIILKDDFLETKQTGDGMLFVYEDKGDIQKQIERGTIAMFAESVIKSPSWQDSDAAQVAEAFLLNQFDMDFTGSEYQSLEPYNSYSAHNSMQWQQFLAQKAQGAFIEGMETLFDDRSFYKSQTLGWNEFSDIIYDETGRAWSEGFEPPVPDPVVEDTTYSYRVMIDWEEGSTTAEIRFEAYSIAIDQLVSVDAEVIGLSETQMRELTFTGASDGVVLNVPSMLENIKLTIKGRNDIKLNPEKPFLFWMYQLRNDDEEERRAEAANGISSYSDNPDIELLLNDVLRSEESDMVIAEVLKSMSEITDGASGTDERFMQFSGSNYAMNIRIAAVEALSNYEGNERVISRLQNIIRQESSDSLQTTALQSLSKIVDTERLAGITSSFIAGNQIPDHVPFLLYTLAENGAGEQAVVLADKTLEWNTPYDVTGEIIRFLIETDESSVNWQNRLPELMSNPHPGVRLAAAEAILKLSAGSRSDFIDTILPNEFDERVRRKLREM